MIYGPIACPLREILDRRWLCHHQRVAGPVSPKLCLACPYRDEPSVWTEVRDPRSEVSSRFPIGSAIAVVVKPVAKLLGLTNCKGCESRRRALDRKGEQLISRLAGP